MPLIKKVIVAGASGGVGPSIISALISKGFSVSVLTRESSTATFSDDVKVYRTDYSAPSLLNALKGQDAVVSAVAATSCDLQVSIINAAIAAGVKRFIPSEYGIDTVDPEVLDFVPAVKGKLDTVKYLREQEGTGLSWTAVIIGAILDWTFQYPGMMGWNIPGRKAVIFDGGNTAYEAITLDQVGRAVVAILTDNFDDTKNNFVYINSFTVTQNQILGILEKVTGDRFEIQHLESAELTRRSLKQPNSPETAKAQSSFPRFTSEITAAIYNNGGFNSFSKTRGLWNNRLGLPDGDLEATLVQGVQEKGRAWAYD